MAETTLVDSDIEASRALVKFLESHGYPLKAAMWMYYSEAERWRFVVCPQEQRKDPTTFYRTFVKAIHDAGQSQSVLRLDRVDIVDATSPLVSTLGSVIRIEGDSSVRFTNNRINGVFLEDALIFKLAS